MLLDTDYLVVGAGASGLAFVDALIAATPARVVIVDRRDQAGGHWLDAYPFVRLHQPSAIYGVTSRRLGEDRIDTSGPNAGLYERASADEICAYYADVLDDLIRSEQVQFLPMCDYVGKDNDGHHVSSRVSGHDTVVRARTLVDATYTASEIPLRHRRAYAVEPSAHVIPPNDLVDLGEPVRAFTLIGGGKTAMDTCVWLLEHGVDPERIQWVRPRDSWLFNRARVQPLELVGSFLQMQASWMQAAAQATDGYDFARRMADDGVLLRVDPAVEPEVFRGATISTYELEKLRSIERVVRMGHVRQLDDRRIVLDQGEVATEPGTVYVDCTAAGVPPTTPRALFEPARITLQYVTTGIVPWSAATVGTVEATVDDMDEKNRLCPVVPLTGNVADMLGWAHAGLVGGAARSAVPDLATWNNGCRLNPTSAAAARLDDPQVSSALTAIMSTFPAAWDNLAQRVLTPAP